MGHKQIRLGQLIAPFGPGAIYTDRRGTPHVVCGLDAWHRKYSDATGLQDCDDLKEFLIFEPRLASLLGVEVFRSPADFRAVRKGQTPAPNSGLYTPAHRFPRWYRHSRSGKLSRFNLSTRKLPPEKEGRWLPVRFVAACEAGHLCEFPWKEWLECSCPGDGDLYLTDRGGSELSSIKIECRSCPPGSTGTKGRNLAGTMRIPEPGGEPSDFAKDGIGCPGDRPWLGEGANEACTSNLVGALLNQLNLYYPRVQSAILLPDVSITDATVLQLRQKLEEDPSIGTLKMLWQFNDKSFDMVLPAAMVSLSKAGVEGTPDQVKAALESLFEGAAVVQGSGAGLSAPESRMAAFRRSEYDSLRATLDDPIAFPDLRVVEKPVASDLTSWISKVNLVERLRETRVFFGFDRLRTQGDQLQDMPDRAIKQLFARPPKLESRWLPAVKVYGEGLYVELQHERIVRWQEANESRLRKRLSPQFIDRLYENRQTIPPLTAVDWVWASRYLLVHTLAHIVLNQLVFECGYSSASLRERLFVSADPGAPMAGFLIYTAAGDADGTLGGLVRLGYPDRFSPMFRRALSRAAWCSADPVCSEDLGGTGSQLANMAACHACVLLPETSCETINNGLDRAMVVGTPDERTLGAMWSLVASGAEKE